MKAVVIGTDLLYDKDGNLRVLEINSNIGIHTKAVDLLKWDNFKSFLVNNKIKKVHLIYSYFNIVGEYETGFHTKLKQVVSDMGLVYVEHFTNTVNISPTIKDTNDSLILRLSFDSKAMIDKYYTSDKIKFLNLIRDKDYNANYYYNSNLNDDFNFDGIISLYENAGFIPNYIEKKRFPHNKMNLFKFTDSQQLEFYKENTSFQNYLQEFYYNPKNLVKNKMGVIRSVDFLYGSSLDIFHFGMYKTTGHIPFNIFPTDYNSDGSMKQSSLDMWLSKPHQWDNFNYFLDESSFMIGKNNEKMGVSDISANSSLKTISFNWVSDIDNNFHIQVNNGNLNEDLKNISVSNEFISGLIGRYIGSVFFEIQLESGVCWEDLVSTIILTEKFGKTTFKTIKNLELGDSVVLFCNKRHTLLSHKIKKITPIFKQKQIFSIESPNSNFFLPIIDEESNLSLIQYSSGGSKPV
jgi:hypothetical protein